MGPRRRARDRCTLTVDRDAANVHRHRERASRRRRGFLLHACLLEDEDQDASALLLDSRRLLKLVKELFAGISHGRGAPVANLRACDLTDDATISLPGRPGR